MLVHHREREAARARVHEDERARLLRRGPEVAEARVPEIRADGRSGDLDAAETTIPHQLDELFRPLEVDGPERSDALSHHACERFVLALDLPSEQVHPGAEDDDVDSRLVLRLEDPPAIDELAERCADLAPFVGDDLRAVAPRHLGPEPGDDDVGMDVYDGGPHAGEARCTAAPAGAYLGDARFRDFWAAAEQTGALVFVHPSTRGFALPVMDEHYMWNTVGNPLETTVSAVHMVGAGVLDEHCGLHVLLAHGGGALAVLRGRLAREQQIHPSGRDAGTAIRRFHVDTVVHDADVLRGLVELFGAEHVLCGSDYPFDMGVERPAEIVRALGLPAEGEAEILGGNALRLLGQERPA